MTEASDDRMQQLLDLFVYAPIGALSSLAGHVPDLAAAGRQRATAARMVGRFALDGADAKVVASLDDARRHLDAFLEIVADAADRSTRGGRSTHPDAD